MSAGPGSSPAGAGELEAGQAASAIAGEQLPGSVAAYAALEGAANTRRAYASDWADFLAWCATHGRQALPAAGDDVAEYLAQLAGLGRAVATLERRMAAIRHKHKFADLAPPAGQLLTQAWAGIRQTHGRPPRQKRAILTEDLRGIVAELPTNLSGLRDRALILLGFASALRRSELASVWLAGPDAPPAALQLSFVARGGEVFIPRSKADQAGQGALIGVPLGRDLCPVRAVQAWLEAAGIEAGPIFRSVSRSGSIGATAISGQTVAAIYKAAAARVGIDPRTVGGHSSRAGMITQALINGVDVSLIMKISRHRKVDTMNGYVRLADPFMANAAAGLGL